MNKKPISYPPMLIDTHCHLHDDRFKNERFLALQRAYAAGVSKIVNIGCDVATSEHAKALALVHESLYFSSGIHPHDAKDATKEVLDKIYNIATHPKCVGIGECGLDFFYKHSSQEQQIHTFLAQIEMAKSLQKPLILHIREAFPLAFDLLKPHAAGLKGAIVHCFTGTWEDAKQALELGFYISIPGIVTFKKAAELPEVVKQIPLECLLLETDAPYLAPEPYRGKRNEPAYIKETGLFLAQILNIDKEVLFEATTHNANRVFGWSA